MLGRQHLRKVMLGGDVVWSKHRPQPPVEGLSLESLEHKKVKLKATNQNDNLLFPMFFPDRLRNDYQDYRDRLTFVGNAIVSLQTIDAMLIGDVVENDIHFPMFFFDEKPPEGTFDYHNNLTFIANEPPEPESVVDYEQDFMINAYDPDTDYIQDFTVDVELPPDYEQDFMVNAYDPTKDFIKDFTIQAIRTVDYTQDFSVQAIQTTDYIADFTVEAIQCADVVLDFTVEAINTMSYTQDFTVNVMGQVYVLYAQSSGGWVNRYVESEPVELTAQELAAQWYITKHHLSQYFSSVTSNPIPIGQTFTFMAQRYISDVITDDFEYIFSANLPMSRVLDGIFRTPVLSIKDDFIFPTGGYAPHISNIIIITVGIKQKF